MNAPTLQALEINPATIPDCSVIWLHGLGADGYDFEPIVAELDLPVKPSIRFVFPHAPSRPVTLNGGVSMPAWFDLYTLDLQAQEDEAGIRQMAGSIECLIEQETQRGLAYQRIVLAGFSQGGALAIHTATRFAGQLAGLIALSSYLPLPQRLALERSPVNAALPTFMAHGTVDQTVLYQYGVDSRDELLKLNYPVEWRDYPIAHGVCQEEIQDIREWLLRVLG